MRLVGAARQLPSYASTSRVLTSLRTPRACQSNQRQYSTPKSWIPVPFVQEQVAGVTHTTDLFSRLLKERIISVYGEVDERLVNITPTRH
jgi:hypothetical protein